MVDGYWKRCFETSRVINEEDVNPLASGMAAGEALLASGLAAATGSIIQATPPWDRRPWWIGCTE